MIGYATNVRMCALDLCPVHIIIQTQAPVCETVGPASVGMTWHPDHDTTIVWLHLRIKLSNFMKVCFHMYVQLLYVCM